MIKGMFDKKMVFYCSKCYHIEEINYNNTAIAGHFCDNCLSEDRKVMMDLKEIKNDKQKEYVL